MTTSRREFLTTAVGTSAVVSVGATPPSFLLRACAAADQKRDETVLVVIQLSGGNDGLNTVAPHRSAIYRRNRPTLAVNSDDALTINNELGFHPAAAGLASLLEANKLAIVQGVGYPNPNRSHFESMDIWHTCQRKTDVRREGWLGRFLGSAGSSNTADLPAIHLGGEKQPLALANRDIRIPSIGSVDRFKLNDGGNRMLRDVVSTANRNARDAASDLLGFVQTSTGSALRASQRIEAAGAKYKTSTSYPDTRLAGKLKTIAQLVDSGLNTRIYYVTLDGFDTHAQQGGAHAGLLRELSGAMNAFVTDLNEHGHGDRVTVMAFSEFGRRLKENASEGTDHGAAAPMFLAGNKVRSGLIGRHPSLEDLNDGDVKFHTDFRQVYATVVERWLGVSAHEILGGRYDLVDAFA